jgi:hypothetical protein
LGAEVTARATELVDVSLDIGWIGRAVKSVHERTTDVCEKVSRSAEDKRWEHETLQTLKLRKARWNSMQQVQQFLPCYFRKDAPKTTLFPTVTS